MPKPPQLAPLNAEEKQFYSELLPDVQALHPIRLSPATRGHTHAEFICDFILSVNTQSS